MLTIRTIAGVPAHPFRLLRLAVIGIMAMLILTIAANPVFAQTPAPAAPANLTAELTDTEGEVLLSWDTAEGATSYRACRRVQNPPGGWNCTNRTTMSVLFNGLTVGTVYDFAVAPYDGQSYSSWVWTELTVEAVTTHICPVTGLAIPEGYLSVNDKTTNIFGDEFTLTSITRQSTFRLNGANYSAFEGRQLLKVCGTLKAPSGYTAVFLAGFNNNLATDSGIGFTWFDEGTTNWRDTGEVPAGASRTACDVWDVPDDATVAIYAVNNLEPEAAVYRVDLPAN
ncbi:MAG: hypothetical protein F4X64_17440 [Chloroflexi bacterium]|nr:hypothetical protein [Chloroflexota bacterium]